MARALRTDDIDRLGDDDLYDEAWGPIEPPRRVVTHRIDRTNCTGRTR